MRLIALSIALVFAVHAEEADVRIEARDGARLDDGDRARLRWAYGFCIANAGAFRVEHNRSAAVAIPAASDRRYLLAVYPSTQRLAQVFVRINPAVETLYGETAKHCVAFTWHAERTICLGRIDGDDLVHELAHMLWPDDVLTADPNPARGELLADEFIRWMKHRVREHDEAMRAEASKADTKVRPATAGE